MPRSRSYSRSPSRSSNKKSSRRSRSRDRSREKYVSSSRRRSRSRSRSKKVLSRYKSSPSRRRSRSGDRRRKSKYYSSSKKEYRRERSRSRERDRYTKRRSRSSSIESRSSNSSCSASSSSTVASKVSIKSEKEVQMIPLKIPSHQPVAPSKNTLQFSSVDLVGDFVKPEIIDELNADDFIPKHFQSGGKKHLPDNIKIDLNSESISLTTKLEDGDKKVNLEDEFSIFHPNLFGDESVRMDKWVRKLYMYRQKMFLSEN